MNILILQRFDLSSVSCARRVVCQTEELLRRGHKVVLSDFPHPERHTEVPTVENMKRFGGTILPLQRKVYSFFQNIQTLKTIAPKPDIIHLWKAYPDVSLLAVALSRHWNIPIHYDWDDWEKGIACELANSKIAGTVAGWWDRFFPAMATTMSAASGFLKENAIAYGFPSDRIWDAPVGADLEKFYPREKDQELMERWKISEPVIAYIGQLEVASYAELAVDVLERVQRTVPAATLLIVGGGRKLEAIQQRAKKLGVADKVVCTNYVPAEDIPRYLSLADVALAPFEENDVTRAKSPLKIAEYLASGVPVVASDVGEAPVMTKGAGYCVPCGDTNAMAERVNEILADSSLQQSMREAGIQTAQTKYNWKSHTDELEKAYLAAMRYQK
jgi:glycosyltransferase involved in cell wall biosynthesis